MRRGPVDPLLDDHPPVVTQPAWLMTYADLVTLLLTCFIMLVGMSELREPDRYSSLLGAMRNQFGEEAGGWFSTGPSPRAARRRAAWAARSRRQTLLKRNTAGATPSAPIDLSGPAQAGVRVGFAASSTTLAAPALAELDRFAAHVETGSEPVELRTTVDTAGSTPAQVDHALALAQRRTRHVTEALMARRIAAVRIRPEIVLSSLSSQPDQAPAADPRATTGTAGSGAEIEVRLLSGR
ncbi:MAG: flagellar motor protein MotB [Pirellulales bacterium]|nr:flagellar motor protein MotB [Pirellulales bacterium]